ncbi:MAG: PTS sugar transporter subunit IIA [Pseudomonadota bacterium]
MNIAEVLNIERVRLDLSITSKKSVLETLASMIAESSNGIAQGGIFDGFVARERLGTTGLGAGIAIPHARVGETEVVAAFVRTKRGIDFDAVDGNPVDLFIALCVPTEANDEHLRLLASLAEKLSDDSIVAALRATQSPSAVVASLSGAEE